VSTITDGRSRNKNGRIVVVSTVFLAAFFHAGIAAAVDCKDLPSPIYGIGGSATKPLLAKIGTALSAASPPETVVYQAPGACVGVNALLGSTPLQGTATFWDATGKEDTCTLPVDGEVPGFANTGNSALTCPGVSALPSEIGDFVGPVNAFSLIVPNASSQVSISSEAAYFVFGFGQLGKAQPWVDDTQIFRRDPLSAAQIFISLATGVPTEKFKGIDTKSNGGTVTAVAQSTKPEAAIGLVSAEVADANRATVRTLAYQHKGQRCGYWPDSSATTFDKKNVRDGTYHIWSPIHFYARVDTSKKATNPGIARFVGYFTGEVAAPTGVDVLAIESKSGAIPRCAMSVWRDADLGDVRKYQPEKPCGCFFESVAAGKTSCQVCTNDTSCPSSAPKCNYGFCEAR